MKTLLLITTLLINFSSHAGNCSKQEKLDEFDSPIAYIDDSNNEVAYDDFTYFFEDNPEIKEKLEKIQNFDTELNKYLLTSSDINIQLFALTSSDFDEFDLEKTKNNLHTVINLNSDKYTMFLADSVCHNQSILTNWCHKLNIHDIHLEVDPYNFETYKFLLNDNENEEIMQEYLLLAAENSRYNNSFYFHYAIEKSESIAKFIELYPENSEETFISTNPYLLKDLSKIDEENLKRKGLLIQDIKVATAETLPFLIAMNFNTGLNRLNIVYNGICKQEINATSCLKISDILIQNNNLLINKFFGHEIKNVVYKTLGKDTNLINKFDTIFSEHSCYTSEDFINATNYNKNLLMKYLEIAQEKGETSATKKLAFTAYNTIKKNGYNPAFNPNNCE